MTNLLGIPEIAALYQRSRRTVETWTRQGLRLPATRAEVEAWHAANVRAPGRPRKDAPPKPAAQNGSASADPEATTARYRAEMEGLRWTTEVRKLRAERERLQLEQLRDGVVPRAAVAALFAARVIELKGSLMTMSRSISLEFDADMRPLVQEAVTRHVRELLERYSRPLDIEGEAKDSRGGRRGRVTA